MSGHENEVPATTLTTFISEGEVFQTVTAPEIIKGFQLCVRVAARYRG
ncbi:MAG: hypothetical protein Q4G30_00105 [Actinomycetaceae bacterium]|nr:hypothetical protein [Actinomycetaceae bacterium]